MLYLIGRDTKYEINTDDDNDVITRPADGLWRFWW